MVGNDTVETENSDTPSDFGHEPTINQIHNIEQVLHADETDTTLDVHDCDDRHDAITKSTHMALKYKDVVIHEHKSKFLTAHRVPKMTTFQFPKVIWHQLIRTKKGRCLGSGEWESAFMERLKQSNPYCAIMFKWHKVSTARVRHGKGPLFSAVGKCAFIDCSISVRLVLKQNFTCNVYYTGKMRHGENELHARPIRGPDRRDYRSLFSLGVKPYKLHINRLATMEQKVYESGNRDSSGQSEHVFQKISSVTNTQRRLDIDELRSLQCLRRSKF